MESKDIKNITDAIRDESHVLNNLKNEADEIISILTSIIKKSKKNV